MIKLVVDGKMPCYWDVNVPALGIRKAAEAVIRAEGRGRIDERHLITERTLTLEELYDTAAEAARRSVSGRPCRWSHQPAPSRDGRRCGCADSET